MSASTRRSARVKSIAVVAAPVSAKVTTITPTSKHANSKAKVKPKAVAAADVITNEEASRENENDVSPKAESTASSKKRKRGESTNASSTAKANLDTKTTTSPRKQAKASSASSSSLEKAVVVSPQKARQARPVQPHKTNAPLQTPRGSRILAMPPLSAAEGKVLFSSGDAQTTGASSSIITTHNLLEKACAHLIAQDPRLKPVIDKNVCRLFSPEGLAKAVDPFHSLASGIISQQVSGAAARSIRNKFVGLYISDADAAADAAAVDADVDADEVVPERPQALAWPTPAQVAATDIATLRTAGLSQRKAEYIQGLAQKFASGELSAQMLAEASDEEVMERLIAVRGLGRWSVEMFACFALKRTDIFSTGDLGVQRGMAAFMGKDVAKLKAKGGGKWKYMSEADMLSISEKFSPYRSLFMWYMWRIEDVNIDAIQDN